MPDWVLTVKHMRIHYHTCQNDEDFGIIFEIYSLIKFYTANITPIWFLACMYQPVVPKCWVCCKYLIAVFTLVGSLTKVDPFMVLHVPTLRVLYYTKHLYGVSAIWTRVRFFISMSLWQITIHGCHIRMVNHLCGGICGPVRCYAKGNVPLHTLQLEVLLVPAVIFLNQTHYIDITL